MYVMQLEAKGLCHLAWAVAKKRGEEKDTQKYFKIHKHFMIIASSSLQCQHKTAFMPLLVMATYRHYVPLHVRIFFAFYVFGVLY